MGGTINVLLVVSGLLESMVDMSGTTQVEVKIHCKAGNVPRLNYLKSELPAWIEEFCCETCVKVLSYGPVNSIDSEDGFDIRVQMDFRFVCEVQGRLITEALFGNIAQGLENGLLLELEEKIKAVLDKDERISDPKAIAAGSTDLLSITGDSMKLVRASWVKNFLEQVCDIIVEYGAEVVEIVSASKVDNYVINIRWLEHASNNKRRMFQRRISRLFVKKFRYVPQVRLTNW